jgi:peptide subunit release factor 1 (eRF1)
MLDKKRVTFSCRECGEKITKTLGWLKAHPDFACPNCGTRYDVNKLVDSFAGGEAQQAIDKFRANLRKS